MQRGLARTAILSLFAETLQRLTAKKWLSDNTIRQLFFIENPAPTAKAWDNSFSSSGEMPTGKGVYPGIWGVNIRDPLVSAPN